MSVALILLLLVVVLLPLHCYLSYEFYQAAIMKGWSQKKYLLLPLFTGVFGFLLVLALPDRGGNHVRSITCDDLPEL